MYSSLLGKGSPLLAKGKGFPWMRWTDEIMTKHALWKNVPQFALGDGPYKQGEQEDLHLHKVSNGEIPLAIFA